MIYRALGLLAGISSLFGHAPVLADILLENVLVVDIESGEVSDLQSILIDGTRIDEMGKNISAGPEVVRLDAADRYLIPGLWDSHVHVFSSADEPDTAFPMYLINGITGIRDMGALWPLDEQKKLRERIEAGDIVAPRLILSGAWVDASPGSWPGMFLADNPAEARTVVERIVAEEWAAVKAYSMLDRDTYLALADAAKSADIPLVGHIPERVSLVTAIEAGQSGMEHFGRITMACSTQEAGMIEELRQAMSENVDRTRVFEIMAARNRRILDSWDEQLCKTVVGRLSAADLHISPTLVVADFYMGNWPRADAPRMQVIPKAVREGWGEPDFRLEAMTDEVRALADESIALDRRTFLMAHRAGVPFLASSDASFANPYLFHGYSLLDELEIYVSLGLTPREALYTATVAPPRFFDLDDQNGTITVGQRADLVLLDSNPLEGLQVLRSPYAVIVGGQLLDRTALAEMEAQLLSAAELSHSRENEPQ